MFSRFTFSRRFYPKRLTMYTHFKFTLMAHCTSGAIRGSVSNSRTLRQGIELATLLITKRLLYHRTTVARPPPHTHYSLGLRSAAQISGQGPHAKPRSAPSQAL